MATKYDELKELITHYRRGLNKIIRTRHNRAAELRQIALECLTHKPDSFAECPPSPSLVELFRAELQNRFSPSLSMEEIGTFAYWLADKWEIDLKQRKVGE